MSEQRVYDREYYKTVFVTGSMALADLSRENTGNPEAPKYQTLKLWAMPKNNEGVGWTEEREQYSKNAIAIVNGAIDERSRERLTEVLMPFSTPQNASRYSRYVSEGMARSLEHSLSDPNLMALQDEIALVDARTAEMLENLNTMGAARLWSDLSKLVDELEVAQRTKDDKAVVETSHALVSMIREGYKQRSLWDDIFRNINQRAALIDIESKRQARGDRSVPIESLMVFLEAFKTRLHQRAVIENLTSESLIKAVKEDLQVLMGGIDRSQEQY